MMEMKAYALVQHYQNRNFRKAIDTEYDMKVLAIEHGIKDFNIAARHMTAGQVTEIKSIINN
jgi:hypothetical protein